MKLRSRQEDFFRHGVFQERPGAAVLLGQFLFGFRQAQDGFVLFQPCGNGFQPLSIFFAHNGHAPVRVDLQAQADVLRLLVFKQRQAVFHEPAFHAQGQAGHVPVAGIGG